MSTTMTVECPSCDTAFPVDPAKVPEGGARTRCTVCETEFRVDAPYDARGDAEDAFWTPEPEAGEAGLEEPAGEVGVADEPVAADEPEAADEPVAADAVDEVDGIAEVEEAWVEAVEEPEPVEAAELVTEVEAGELETAEEPSGSVDELDDWVVETEETGTFGAADETEIQLDELDAVPEEEGDEAYTAFMADEVVLSADELDVTVEEVEVEPPAMEGDETPELPPLEVEDTPTPEMAAETVLEDLDEVETVFEPEEAEEVSADEPMGEAYVEEAEVEPAPIEAEPGPEPEEQETGEAAPEVEVEPEAVEAEPAPEPEPASEPEEAPAPTGFQFGKRDPHDKARRLARVLVSDMITYNPERHARALENDSLKEDFEEEIEKSWAEYVEQVGQDLAESTSYWNEALNEILARGRPLF